MPEVSTEQSEDGRKHLKRLYEYTKKAMSFEALLLLALLNQHQQSLYHSNTAFKVSLAMLLVAFFTNLLTGVLLNSFSFLPFFKYPTYISSIIQMLVPFGLLVSSGHLQPYMILVSPLPFFSIALFHRADTTTDDASSALDHIFDMSAGVYALLSAGCALTSPYFMHFFQQGICSIGQQPPCLLALRHHIDCSVPDAHLHTEAAGDHCACRDPDAHSEAAAGTDCDLCRRGVSWMAPCLVHHRRRWH